MPKVTFITPAGRATTIDAAAGMTVMRAAVMNAVPGIDAECGGCCACATCHVIVDPEWAGRLPAIDDMEKDTLDLIGEPTPTSRLSCQLTLTPALDGLIVRTPARQG
jgi:2Fe-2S ferredoxin